MSERIYIDGHVGTTGLRIRQLLAERDDLVVETLPEALRKDDNARREIVREADVCVLCLPDEAARDVAQWCSDRDHVRIIDASTAHRTDPDWIYGLAELVPEHRSLISGARRVSNPGCYASAFVLLVRPLVDTGVIKTQVGLSVHGLSGYSGGGRALIERWESSEGALNCLPYEAPYAYERIHKHIPEMTTYSRLHEAPQFLPSVGPFYCGMRVQVPLHQSIIDSDWGAERIHSLLHTRYCDDPFIQVMPLRTSEPLNESSLDPRACNDTNRLNVHVIANPAGHVCLTAILDNLGKGASGMAVQSLNLMLGREETLGLVVD